MRGTDKQQLGVFSYISVEDRVPRNHPLRGIRCIVDAALQDLDRVLGAMYAKTGRNSIAPEKLIRALLLQVFYSIRSERQLMEQLDYNLLFRWFVGMNLDDPVWDHSTFSKNRDRLIEVDIARRLMLAVVEQARGKNLVSEEHFSVDGTLIEAWASHKSFRPKNEEPPTGGGRNPEVDFHGERRINDTHASRTDPESRLYRKAKGKEAKLCYMPATPSWRTVMGSWSMVGPAKRRALRKPMRRWRWSTPCRASTPSPSAATRDLIPPTSSAA